MLKNSHQLSMTTDDRTAAFTTDYPSTTVSDLLEDDNDSWLNYLPATVTTLKTVTLLSTSAICAGLAWLGGSMLFYILLSRYFSPEAAHHSRSLYFDYTKADAVATAHFLPDIQYNRAMLSAAAASQARFLSSRQRFDVWLELATPEAHGQEGDEVFQVIGELLSADGRVAGTSSRPCLVRQGYWLSRTFKFWLTAPFAIVGLWDERREVRIPLFSNYREQATTPFVVFKATLQPRAGGGRLPQLYEAKVHVRLRLGIISRLLIMTKPGSMVTWILVAASLISLFGGGLGSVALFLLWFVTRGASSISSARSHLGTAGIREEKADVDKELSDDDDPASPEDVQGMVDDFIDDDFGQKRNYRGKGDGSSGRSTVANDESNQHDDDARKQYYASYSQHTGPKKLS